MVDCLCLYPFVRTWFSSKSEQLDQCKVHYTELTYIRFNGSSTRQEECRRERMPIEIVLLGDTGEVAEQARQPRLDAGHVWQGGLRIAGVEAAV